MSRLPDKWKNIADFIDRLGYPIVVSIFLGYMCFVQLQKNTVALIELTAAIREIKP